MIELSDGSCQTTSNLIEYAVFQVKKGVPADFQEVIMAHSEPMFIESKVDSKGQGEWGFLKITPRI